MVDPGSDYAATARRARSGAGISPSAALGGAAGAAWSRGRQERPAPAASRPPTARRPGRTGPPGAGRSEEHTSELQSQSNLVCRLLLEKKTPGPPERANENCSSSSAI